MKKRKWKFEIDLVEFMSIPALIDLSRLTALGTIDGATLTQIAKIFVQQMYAEAPTIEDLFEKYPLGVILKKVYGELIDDEIRGLLVALYQNRKITQAQKARLYSKLAAFNIAEQTKEADAKATLGGSGKDWKKLGNLLKKAMKPMKAELKGLSNAELKVVLDKQLKVLEDSLGLDRKGIEEVLGMNSEELLDSLKKEMNNDDEIEVPDDVVIDDEFAQFFN